MPATPSRPLSEKAIRDAYRFRLSLIETELEALLPEQPTAEWISKNGGSDLRALQPEPAAELILPARTLLLRGGKRWRPMLLLLTTELLSNKDFASHPLSEPLRQALKLTPLVELPHNGSLIIDDIEDRSDFRRGEKAVHLLYGEDLSINAGNLIYFLPATRVESASLSPQRQAAVYSAFLRALRRLHLGQGMDIVWHRRPDFFPDQAAYETMCRLKTGALARLAVELAEILVPFPPGSNGNPAADGGGGTESGGGSVKVSGGGNSAADGGSGDSSANGNGNDGVDRAGGQPKTPPENGASPSFLAKVAENMGLAFQIIDDVTNLRCGNPGKKRGDDIVEGKKSLPVLLFAEKNDPAPLIDLIRRAQQLGIDRGRDAVEAAVALITESGALNEAQQTAQMLIRQSLLQLEGYFPPSPPLQLIQWMFNGFKVH